MGVNEETVKKLLSSLEDYNSVANSYATSISTALNIVGLTLIGILLYLEIANMQKKLTSEQGVMTIELLISVCWKYFVALAFVMLSDKIIDTFVWLSSAIGHLINAIPIATAESTNSIPDVTGKLGWAENILLNIVRMFSNFTMWAGEIVTDVLVFLRFLILYVYKAVAGVMFASFVSDEWSSIAKSYIRQFLALIIQGFILLLLMKMFSALALGEFISITANGDDFVKNLGQQFLFICKSVAYIGVLFGSQRLTQKMVGG